MISMLIDHIGIVFFPDNLFFRIVGRVAFPLYTYGIVQGFFYTRSRGNYFFRLLVLAMIAQIPYMLALQVASINVIGTFVVCLAVLMLLQRFPTLWAILITLVLSGALLSLLPFDYGAYALCLVLIYRYAERRYWIWLHVALNVLSFFIFGASWAFQIFSIAATALIAYSDSFARLDRQFSVPKWVWRAFYPAHLALLYGASFLIHI